MAVERVDLAGSFNLEPTAPVSSAPAVQAQVSPQEKEGKPRRRPPPEEALAEAAPEGEEGDDSSEEQPPHRLDDLA
ncbi:MAG: hypothetical protein ABSA78_16740 [Candidatus Sulfotelmatobacter sp.]|jgi:hypothetical protein